MNPTHSERSEETPKQGADAELPAKLRNLVQELRRTPKKLSEVIPFIQAAADALDLAASVTAQVASVPPAVGAEPVIDVWIDPRTLQRSLLDHGTPLAPSDKREFVGSLVWSTDPQDAPLNSDNLKLRPAPAPSERSEETPITPASDVLRVKAGDAFIAQPGTVVEHVTAPATPAVSGEAVELVTWIRWFLRNVNDPSDFRWVRMKEAADIIESFQNLATNASAHASTDAALAVCQQLEADCGPVNRDEFAVHFRRKGIQQCINAIRALQSTALASPITQASTDAKDAALEAEARAIYERFPGAAKHPWVTWGNSHMQEKARDQASSARQSTASVAQSLATNPDTKGEAA